MVKRILKALTNNLGFKILAVIFSFMLWLVVYNMEDPVITRTYTSVVSVRNEDKVTEMNKCYEILDASNIISFSVSAKRSILEKLEDSDFTAVADMANLIMDKDSSVADVRVDVSSSRYNNLLKYNGKTQYMKVALDNLLSKQFVVTPNTDGTVAEGYALGAVTVANPNVLKVSGPESIVGQIASVVATIDVDGMTMYLSDNVIPILYDVDGKEIPTTNLRLSNTTVQISAQILGTKQLPLKCSTIGTPSGGNSVLGIVCKPSKVMVKGTAAALNQISSIEVPAEILNVAGVTEDLETSIDITEYLPPNVELLNVTDANISVIVKIEKYASGNYTILTANLEVKGLSQEDKLEYETGSIVFSVTGSEENISKLSVADIKGSIDVTGLGEGSHMVGVETSLDENMFIWNPVEVLVRISKIQEEESQEQEEQEEQGGQEELEETGNQDHQDNRGEQDNQENPDGTSIEE